MPLAYGAGTLAEHMACRTDAVAFDVSHLGTVRVEGAGALDLLQRELSNDLRKVAPGRAQYTHLLDDADGSVVDDIIVWWLADDVVRRHAQRVEHRPGARRRRRRRHHRHPRRDRRAGPPGAPPAGLGRSRRRRGRRFRVTRFSWSGVDCVAAGTGYTGEDGVECSVPVDSAAGFWQAVLDAGVAPAGLGARDTLRLEAGLPLHGHELGPGITPLQAGLGWVVGWDKGDFRGRGPLERERASGPRRLLCGAS